MAYVDYEFYTTKYYGNVIAEKDFPRLSERASDKIDTLTFGRLGNFPTDEDVIVKVKKCVCALAEQIADYELTQASIRQNGGSAVSSVSSGSESISFRADASIGSVEQNQAFMMTAREYLSGTGLLYAGF